MRLDAVVIGEGDESYTGAEYTDHRGEKHLFMSFITLKSNDGKTLEHWGTEEEDHYEFNIQSIDN